jgi:signal transduction histidine kinase
MAIVLAATGAFIYVRLEHSLTTGIDETLDSRVEGLRSSAAIGRAGDDEVVQLLDARGALVSSSPVPVPPLVSPREVARGARRDVFVDVGRVAALDGEPARALVTRTHAGRAAVLVVATSLQDREDALHRLLTQLLIVGPLALLLSSVGGYFLAAAALRPVETMRSEAEVVSASEPGRRLTLPPAHDEIHRLGETLNTMLGRLESALDRERRFVADASHELRTPLATLRAELELALRGERDAGELRAALRSASEETERLTRLAEDLLVLAGAENGAVAVRKTPVPVEAMLGAVAGRFRARSLSVDRAIHVEADPDLVATLDRERVEQALGNLVDNALRHGDGAIVLEARAAPGRLELHVRDEGPGVDAQLAAHALEPFTRGDPARTGEGAGLGLAIVDVIARAHGGSAHVAAASGSGADAWIALPTRS